MYTFNNIRHFKLTHTHTHTQVRGYKTTERSHLVVSYGSMPSWGMVHRSNTICGLHDHGSSSYDGSSNYHGTTYNDLKKREWCHDMNVQNK